MFDDKIRIREMNKVIFHNNLMSTIHEILGSDNLKEDDIRFKIIPVYERDKSFNAVDDLMRLVILSDSNIGGKLLTVKETVSVVACQEPLVPIWINISYYGKKEDKLIFNFETSLRFRKPSLLRNADTGHPPFKAGIKDMIKNDRVSLWLGYFETPEEFSEYVDVKYDEDGNCIRSFFQEEFGILRYDTDAVERDWIASRCDNVQALLEGFSCD